MKNRFSRRGVLGTMLASGVAVAAFVRGGRAPAFGAEPLKGNINHSVCRWCYGKISLEDLCKAAKRIGLKSIELLSPDEWPILKEFGLTCAIAQSGTGLTKGFNNPAEHERLIKAYEELIPAAAKNGVPSVICFSGNRNGISDEEGLKNCAEGIKKIIGLCEKHKVNLVMELLNSKVNHKGYQCDHTAWGVELCKMVGSERFGLLYDIYHMQIMEGDLIRTIKENAQYLKHYHTGGNPGRHEIDETQEIYYPAVMRAIVETGYTGYVGQEFIPTGPDPLASLEKCVRICDV
ncbi:MAG: hydroxypyruvate isomerase [Planctomycetota bacterium]|nr:MAG: hydroxypyruvate isomerase [Planctomycetota bacterium]